MTPTGRIRYRTNWRGKLILQLEEAYRASSSINGDIERWNATQWRDAKIQDVTIAKEIVP